MIMLQTGGLERRAVEGRKTHGGKKMENMYMNRELAWLKFNERVLEEEENQQATIGMRGNFVYL